MKYLRKINESSSLNTESVWVIYSKNVNSYIDKIYLTKEEAQSICDTQNQESNDYFKTKDVSYQEVYKLSDAIDLIIEYTRDEISSFNNPDY